MGVVLGAFCTAFGHLPDWIVDHYTGSITVDDEPVAGVKKFLPLLQPAH